MVLGVRPWRHPPHDRRPGLPTAARSATVQSACTHAGYRTIRSDIRDGLTRAQIPHNARLSGQRSVPGPPGRLPRLRERSTEQRPGGRRRGVRLPGRGHRRPVIGHHRQEPGAVRHSRRPGQPGSRDHLPALHQRAARYQPGRGRRPAWRGGRAGGLGGRARPGGRGPGRPRPRRLQQAGLRGEQRRPGFPGQVPDRVLRHRGCPVPAQRPAASGSRPSLSRRYSRACGRGGAAPAVGSRPVAPAASPAARPGRPASAAGGPACFHDGGRVKPTTGDSPPLEPGSP